MRWFRRKQPGPSAPDATPARHATPSRPAAAPSRFDWRSYDDVAERYARTHAPVTAVVAADLIELARASSGSRILDIGTGTGAALPKADERAGESGIAVGVDASEGMLRVARGVRVAAAEVINLPFRNEQFDVALANFTLPYFTKLDTALFDVRRVLKPGGRLAVSVWGAEEDDLSKTWRVLVEEAIGRDILRAGIADEMPWAEMLSDWRKLDGALRDAGFRPIDVDRRRYRFEMALEDYIVGKEIEASGRYAQAMLGPELWESFRSRVRAAYAERFPRMLVDFRDVTLACGRRPV